MHEERRKREIHSTYQVMRLGLGQNLDGKRGFGEKKVFESKKKLERSRYLKMLKTGLDLIYI